jgi:hypothetical protein
MRPALLKQLSASIDGFADRLRDYRLARPFKLPRNYPSWETLSILALAHGLGRIPPNINECLNVYGYLWKYWARFTGPIYCLDRELLRQFQLTDAAGLGKIVPPDWQPPVPVLLLALPKGGIKTPDEAEVSYLLIGCDTPDQPFSLIRYPGPQVRRLVTAFSDSKSNVWTNTSRLTSDGQLDLSGAVLGYEITPLEQAWQDSLQAIALQSLMAIAYIPDLLTEGAPPGFLPRGKRGTPQKTKGAKYLYPRWIGKDFKPSQQRAPQSQGQGHHASPATHWRRGHWRNQPHGPGRQMLRPTWIQPTLINAD